MRTGPVFREARSSARHCACHVIVTSREPPPLETAQHTYAGLPAMSNHKSATPYGTSHNKSQTVTDPQRVVYHRMKLLRLHLLHVTADLQIETKHVIADQKEQTTTITDQKTKNIL